MKYQNYINQNINIRINIPKDINNVLSKLNNEGFEAFVVGGCVRDSLYSQIINPRIPKDWDVCTSATPEEIMHTFSDYNVIPTGLKHGTVTVMINHEPIEITTYRIDGEYTDNRRPDNVKFTADLIEDLSRRDFTINAMAYNPNIGLIDPFNGYQDLCDGLIKCVGNPNDRFNEDALRILRAIRFACQLGFTIHSSIGWCIGYTDIKENLKNISAERINSEFCKMIVCNNFHDRLVKHHSLFTLFIPELKSIIGFKQNNPWHIYDVFEHTFHAIENCEEHDLIVRLALLFHDIGKPYCYQDDEYGIRHFKGHGKISSDMTNEIMRRLKFDNDTREKVVELIYYHDVTFEESEKCVKKWLNILGKEQFRRLLELRIADIKAQNIDYIDSRLSKVNNIMSILDKVIKENQCFSLMYLAVNGRDLLDIGYKTGKELGSVLDKLLDKVISGELLNTKETLLEEAIKMKSLEDINV